MAESCGFFPRLPCVYIPRTASDRATAPHLPWAPRFLAFLRAPPMQIPVSLQTYFSFYWTGVSSRFWGPGMASTVVCISSDNWLCRTQIVIPKGLVFFNKDILWLWHHQKTELVKHVHFLSSHNINFSLCGLLFFFHGVAPTQWGQFLFKTKKTSTDMTWSQQHKAWAQRASFLPPLVLFCFFCFCCNGKEALLLLSFNYLISEPCLFEGAVQISLHWKQVPVKSHRTDFQV